LVDLAFEPALTQFEDRGEPSGVACRARLEKNVGFAPLNGGIAFFANLPEPLGGEVRAEEGVPGIDGAGPTVGPDPGANEREGL
jgi:hypothetical protein